MTEVLSHAYATLDDLREPLGDSGGKLSENLLIRALNAASRAVDNHCDRRFWQDDTATPRLIQVGSEAYGIDLPGPDDISTTTGLEVATWNGTDYTGTGIWLPADYNLWPYSANQGGSIYGGWSRLEATGAKLFHVSATRGYQPLQITARWGWSFIPEGVKTATLLKAAQLFKRKDSPYGVAQFGDIAAVQITRKDADVVELLWPYVVDMAMVG